MTVGLQILIFLFDGTPLWLDGARVRGSILSAAFDQNMSLQCILARETLVAMRAREWLHRQVNPLMPFQVMVPVEALRALVTFKWPIVSGSGCMSGVRRVAPIDLLHAGQMAAIESR